MTRAKQTGGWAEPVSTPDAALRERQGQVAAGATGTAATHRVSPRRAVWVKVRASGAERAEWHAKARSLGLTLSDLVGGGHKAATEVVEVVAHLVVIERARSGLADQPGPMQRADTWRTVRLAGVLYH